MLNKEHNDRQGLMLEVLDEEQKPNMKIVLSLATLPIHKEST